MSSSAILQPHEQELFATLSPAVHHQLAGARALYHAVLDVLEPGQLSVAPPQPLSRPAVHLALGLFAKAIKTFRAIELTSSVGLGTDAMALVRVLQETTGAIEFLLQNESKTRAATYNANTFYRAAQLFAAWQDRLPADANGTSTDIAEAFRRELEIALEHVSETQDYKRHWSGRSFESVLKELGKSEWYPFYRHSSSFTHAQDVLFHFYDDDGNVGLVIQPTEDHVVMALAVARELLWSAAIGMFAKLGVPAPELANHRPDVLE